MLKMIPFWLPKQNFGEPTIRAEVSSQEAAIYIGTRTQRNLLAGTYIHIDLYCMDSYTIQGRHNEVAINYNVNYIIYHM